jgi:hypothetical protein
MADAEEEQAPSIVFIVPYRDREQQRQFFINHMQNTVLVGLDAKIFIVHQQDTRGFNRGALKNIGFLAVRHRYPTQYRDITFVFNDIDTMPYTQGFLNYETTHGVIKHFYGYVWALGGIVSIKGADFERLNGFPNFWTWGFEDNLFNMRALRAGLTIDRSQFYPIMDKNILQQKDGLERLVNRKEFDRYLGQTAEGLSSISNLSYIEDDANHYIHVTRFNTGTVEQRQFTRTHDLKKGSRPFSPPRKPASKMRMFLL